MLELCRDEDTSAKLSLFEPCRDEPKVMSTVEKKIIQRISSLDVVKSINLVNLPHGCARGGLCHTDSTDITDFSALLCLQRG